MGGGGGVAHLAHLGGLITGWLYLKADFRTGSAISNVRKATTKKRRLAIVPREESEDEAVTSSARPSCGTRFPAWNRHY